MRLLRALLLLLAPIGLALVLAGPAVGQEQPRVLAIDFENDVNPVTADYVIDEIERAEQDGYDAVAILLDTPGGLAEAMRDIYKRMLESPLPIIVYVSPDGARAASAGVWIVQAADIAAMAPQTNIGSSTPISVGGEDIQEDLRRKVVNDAVASLKSLAETHGRNVEWVEQAVRQASNLTASEALEQNVVDYVAPDLPTLLNEIDGQTDEGDRRTSSSTRPAPTSRQSRCRSGTASSTRSSTRTSSPSCSRSGCSPSRSRSSTRA